MCGKDSELAVSELLFNLKESKYDNRIFLGV